MLAFSGFFSNFNSDITGNAVALPRMVLHTPSAANGYSTCPTGYVGKTALSQLYQFNQMKQVNVCVLSGSTFLTVTSSSTSHPIGPNCPINTVLAGSVSTTQTQVGAVIYTAYFCSTKINNQQEFTIMDITTFSGQPDYNKVCPTGYTSPGVVTSGGSVTGASYAGIKYLRFCVKDAITTTTPTATCTDGTKNQDETDVDCGGKICPKCASGKTCYITADCISQTCMGGICIAPTTGTCNDGIQNQDETAVDCGGATCNACGIGKTCLLNRDCLVGSVCTTTTNTLTVSTPWGPATQTVTSNTCTAVSGGSCSDGIKNGAETDVDCGGNVCSACNAGRTCTLNSDCVSGLTCFNGVCTSTTAPSPQIVVCTSSGGQNATLGDLNNDGVVTLVDAELLARVLNPQSGVYSPSCFNKIKDGNEQDIDCGGNCGTVCPILTAQVPSTFCISLFGTTLCGPSTTVTNPPMYCCQDLNSDGLVNSIDVTKIIEVASGIKPSAGRCSAVNPTYQTASPSYPALACGNNQRVPDLNNDSIINILDYYLVNAIRQGSISIANQNCCNDWSSDGVKDYIPDANLNGFIELGDEASTLSYALGYVSTPSNFCSTQATTTTPPAATCSDGIQNQGETGIDCGGPCAACSTTTPTATCSDGIQNQGETGVDCGGPCAACSTTAPAPSGGGGGGSASKGKAGAGAFVCSNGRLDLGEQCDDGNIFNDDGCSKECIIEYCGDEIVQYGLKEQCDPPDSITCSLGCSLISQVPSPVVTTPTYEEPISYIPEYIPSVEEPSKLPKIIGAIVTAAAIVGAITYILRKKKAKSQQQPFSLPLKYSRGSR